MSIMFLFSSGGLPGRHARPDGNSNSVSSSWCADSIVLVPSAAPQFSYAHVLRPGTHRGKRNDGPPPASLFRAQIHPRAEIVGTQRKAVGEVLPLSTAECAGEGVGCLLSAPLCLCARRVLLFPNRHCGALRRGRGRKGQRLRVPPPSTLPGVRSHFPGAPIRPCPLPDFRSGDLGFAAYGRQQKVMFGGKAEQGVRCSAQRCGGKKLTICGGFCGFAGRRMVDIALLPPIPSDWQPVGSIS